MNKPLTMIVKDTKSKLVNACNNSGLPPVILDLIVKEIYSEIHYLAEKQTLEEEKIYMETINSAQSNEVIDDNVG